jgi:glycine/D-amino acid oxidase-like deaminating enzyme
MPSLKGWSLADHWAGLRPASPDGLPLLGPTATENLFVASGQYRNGILFAPAIAQMMAELVRGQGHIIPEFDPRRFA